MFSGNDEISFNESDVFINEGWLYELIGTQIGHSNQNNQANTNNVNANNPGGHGVNSNAVNVNNNNIVTDNVDNAVNANSQIAENPASSEKPKAESLNSKIKKDRLEKGRSVHNSIKSEMCLFGTGIKATMQRTKIEGYMERAKKSKEKSIQNKRV